MKELNLCEILKGHEGETFYSSAFGNVILYKIIGSELSIETPASDNHILYDNKGCVFNCNAEQDLFPSKTQRDWNKWVEEQKPKTTPKTWSEFITQFGIDSEPTMWFDADMNWGKLGESCSALFKIHQLIEVGYGRNVTKKDYETLEEDSILYYICYNHDIEDFVIRVTNCVQASLIMFHTVEQAEEFLLYPDNIQLLKNYFMI